MLYNLRNGSTISISVERYLDMSDEDLERLELYYRGSEINDPFFGSILEGKPKDDPEEEVVPPVESVLDIIDDEPLAEDEPDI